MSGLQPVGGNRVASHGDGGMGQVKGEDLSLCSIHQSHVGDCPEENKNSGISCKT